MPSHSVGVFAVWFCKINNVSWPTQYSPRDNFSPESEGSVNPKIEVQSREETTVGGVFSSPFSFDRG